MVLHADAGQVLLSELPPSVSNSTIPNLDPEARGSCEVTTTSEDRASLEAAKHGNRDTLIRVESHKKRPLSRRVSRWFITLTFLSAILLVAIVGFLSWIWWGNRSNSRWRRIMIQGWSKQAVTLSAIGIRFAISSLATVATSMIAAVALETRGVPLDDVAQVSIARFSNTGPETFWISALFNKAFLNFRLRLLLVLLLMTTIASQFSSTLLVSDFGQGLVDGFTTSETINLAFSPAILAQYIADDDEFNFTTNDNYWKHYPRPFAAFAEYTEPGHSSDGVDDTGTSLRAFLPYNNQTDRESLLEYHGLAPVFDTHIVCVRPNITNLGFNSTEAGDLVAVYGDLNYQMPVPGRPKPVVWDLTSNGPPLPLPNTSNQVFSTNFSCDMRGWRPSQSLLCILKGVHHVENSTIWIDDGLLSVLDPIFNQTTSDDVLKGVVNNVDFTLSASTGNMHLVIEPPTSPGVFLRSNNAPGPWSTVTIGNATRLFDCSHCWEDLSKPNCTTYCHELSIRASLCFDAFPSDFNYLFGQDFNVSMSSSATRLEPSLTYDEFRGSYNYESVTKQLGVSKESLNYEQRGILHLNGAKLLTDLAAEREEVWTSKSIDRARTSMIYWTPLVAFASARSYTATNPNAVLYEIFNNTIRDTDSPAKALQAVLTVLLETAYYETLPFYSYNKQSWTSKTQFAFIPLGNRGLQIIIVIICVHVLLTTLIMFEFARRSRRSLLRNAWQVIAQISEHPETAEILRRAQMMTDAEISRQVKQEDLKLRTRSKLVKVE